MKIERLNLEKTVTKNIPKGLPATGTFSLSDVVVTQVPSYYLLEKGNK